MSRSARHRQCKRIGCTCKPRRVARRRREALTDAIPEGLDFVASMGPDEGEFAPGEEVPS